MKQQGEHPGDGDDEGRAEGRAGEGGEVAGDGLAGGRSEQTRDPRDHDAVLGRAAALLSQDEAGADYPDLVIMTGEAIARLKAAPIEVEGTGLGFSVAWLEGDVVGVDFCVDNVTARQVFEIRLMDGMGSSNVVQTVCEPSGALVFCGSG